MSEGKATAKEKEKTEMPAVTEKVYDIPTLRSSSVQLLGVTTSTFDGAMQRQTGPLSVTQAKAIIEDWKKGEAH